MCEYARRKTKKKSQGDISSRERKRERGYRHLDCEYHWLRKQLYIDTHTIKQED